MYQESDEILEDVLKIHVKDLIAKDPPNKGELPKEQNGANKPGYQNISAIIVRMKHGPRVWKDPEE